MDMFVPSADSNRCFAGSELCRLPRPATVSGTTLSIKFIFFLESKNFSMMNLLTQLISWFGCKIKHFKGWRDRSQDTEFWCGNQSKAKMGSKQSLSLHTPPLSSHTVVFYVSSLHLPPPRWLSCSQILAVTMNEITLESTFSFSGACYSSVRNYSNA